MLPRRKFTALDDRLYDYLAAHRTPADDAVTRRLQEDTAKLGSDSVMQTSPDQAALLRILVALTGARLAIEVGTFTGFSSLAIARGLPPGGKLHCFDASPEWTAIARSYWREAGVADRIELHLGDAAETLRAFPEDPPIDFAFIDADKTGYPVYWEETVRRLRPGGLVAVDNVLWECEVVEDHARGEDVVAIRDFNERVLADRRVESVMLAVADGLTLARRLP